MVCFGEPRTEWFVSEAEDRVVCFGEPRTELFVSEAEDRVVCFEELSGQAVGSQGVLSRGLWQSFVSFSECLSGVLHVSVLVVPLSCLLFCRSEGHVVCASNGR